jgi:hypothetical protein
VEEKVREKRGEEQPASEKRVFALRFHFAEKMETQKYDETQTATKLKKQNETT